MNRFIYTRVFSFRPWMTSNNELRLVGCLKVGITCQEHLDEFSKIIDGPLTEPHVPLPSLSSKADSQQTSHNGVRDPQHSQFFSESKNEGFWILIIVTIFEVIECCKVKVWHGFGVDVFCQRAIIDIKKSTL
jgi:hypothetical protein